MTVMGGTLSMMDKQDGTSFLGFFKTSYLRTPVYFHLKLAYSTSIRLSTSHHVKFSQLIEQLANN